MMKMFVLSLLALMLLSTGLLIGVSLPMAMPLPADKPVALTHNHSGPTLEQIRSLASLMTLQVQVADVQVSELSGYSGGISAALLVKGDVILATDLSQARFESSDPERREATLVLSRPTAQSPRLDHARTRLVGLWRHGLWEMVPGDKPEQGIMNRVYAEAQRVIERAAVQESLDQRARAQAEAVLGNFFHAMDWKVIIRWRDR